MTVFREKYERIWTCWSSPSQGEVCQNVYQVGGIIGCKYKTSSWHLNGFPIMVVTLGRQNNVREKPTVMLYNYINRYAGTPDKN